MYAIVDVGVVADVDVDVVVNVDVVATVDVDVDLIRASREAANM